MIIFEYFKFFFLYKSKKNTIIRSNILMLTTSEPASKEIGNIKIKNIILSSINFRSEIIFNEFIFKLNNLFTLIT